MLAGRKNADWGAVPADPEPFFRPVSSGAGSRFSRARLRQSAGGIQKIYRELVLRPRGPRPSPVFRKKKIDFSARCDKIVRGRFGRQGGSGLNPNFRRRSVMAEGTAYFVGIWPVAAGQYDPGLDGTGIPDGAAVFGLFDMSFGKYSLTDEGVPGLAEVRSMAELKKGSYFFLKASSGFDYVIALPENPSGIAIKMKN
jgi:hypothetical protein